jgi:hypothetical protein
MDVKASKNEQPLIRNHLMETTVKNVRDVVLNVSPRPPVFYHSSSTFTNPCCLSRRHVLSLIIAFPHRQPMRPIAKSLSCFLD